MAKPNSLEDIVALIEGQSILSVSCSTQWCDDEGQLSSTGSVVLILENGVKIDSLGGALGVEQGPRPLVECEVCGRMFDGAAIGGTESYCSVQCRQQAE